MLVYYWVAIYMLREGTIIPDFVDEPFYVCLGEGFLNMCIILVLVINILAAIGFSFKEASDYVAESSELDDDEYNSSGSFVVFFLVGLGITIVEALVLVGIDYVFHLGEFGESALYLENRAAWNIGFMVVFHIVAVILLVFGIRAFIKQMKRWHQRRIIAKYEKNKEKEQEREIAERERIKAEKIKMEMKQLKQQRQLSKKASKSESRSEN